RGDARETIAAEGMDVGTGLLQSIGQFIQLVVSHRLLIKGGLSSTCVKALLVEDYLPLQKSVAKAIREMGWAVDVAADGGEGRWFGDNHGYDVILLDLMLPKVAGLDILRQVRGKGNPTPILILTAKDAVADRTKGLDLGADDYLVKPFFLDELL